MRRALDKRHLRWLPLVLATALLAWRAIGPILEKVGHPGAALDDAYIHFQYARAFAEGHPWRFQAGEPISTGATSFLWPFVLSPFYLVGFRGEAILWPAWAMSFAALGALAYETYALAKPLTGRGPAIGAAAMVLSFGGYAWGAASGMEVVPFAWLITCASRRAADWFEEDAARTKRNYIVLLALAVASPLMRPEGALTSLALGIVLAVKPWKKRYWAVPFLPAALVPQMLLLLLTGHATSSTAQVKLLFGNPYYQLPDAAIANARVLVGQILDGQVWSAEFLPKGGGALACVGLIAIVWRGTTTDKVARASLALLLALSIFVPCTYATFLWNRLRYLWPFAAGWFIGLACLARAAADVVQRIDRRLAPVAAIGISGVFAGALVVRLEWVLEDVAQSASGIDRQQAWLGRWAKDGLPADARIGVNDTGAIAYFSDKKTFDVVGLTTPTEGRYWIGGQGSRFEHYERMHLTNPIALPTHFIVYPEWMACTPLIGPSLTEATVTDSTILGGQTMRASEARWTYLGSGEDPWTKLASIADVLDVADLESEQAHHYELFTVREGEESVEEVSSPDGKVTQDGGRTNRVHDRFTVNLPADGKLLGVIRASTDSTMHLHVSLGDGKELASLALEDGEYREVTFEIPPDQRGQRTVDVTSEIPFSSFHYWFGPPAP